MRRHVILLAVAALMLSGCGGEGEDQTASDLVGGTPYTTDPSADATPSAAPTPAAPATTSPSSPPSPTSFTGLPDHLFENRATPLVRTDFSDDAAWNRVVAAVTAEVDLGSGTGESWPLVPNVWAVDDRSYEGVTAELVLATAPEGQYRYALLADARSMQEVDADGGPSVVYVDLTTSPVEAEEWNLLRQFRCGANMVAEVEANLSIANMAFDDYADVEGADGVFRGFPG
ncbi:DUF6924 domain-containing protein [Nocardioides sp. CPCC 205120]|uniref:DUF6924 domain-containing protein n=1 Tax=Nocardioides sp. CPCC 205120 TaxID=3406462 RepID=UPI003B50393A